MKKYLKAAHTILILIFIGLVTSLNASGQCNNVHSNYKDLIEWLNGPSGNYVDAQFTLINPSFADGTHYFTAFGQSTLSISGIRFKGGPQTCLLVSTESIPISFSDRTIQCNGNQQMFSSNTLDKSRFTIYLLNNSITMYSLTWGFYNDYTNCIRRGNVIYAFSSKGNDMLIVNLFKGYQRPIQ